MSKYYLMVGKVDDDGTVINQESHGLTRLKTGLFLPKDFCGPLVCNLVPEHSGGVIPTFYRTPAIIGTKQFYRDLLDCGINNIEVQPVVINDLIKKNKY